MNHIKDPKLKPYFIQIDEYNYSVFKTITATESGKEYDSVVGHCRNLDGALKCILNDTMRNKVVDTVKEYLIEYENVTNKLNQIINQ